MRAPLDHYRKRGLAVLASGIVISLTALTAGVVPAVAEPDYDDVVTTVAPKPQPKQEVSAPEPEVTAERPTSAPEPVVPQTPATQAPQKPPTQAPVVEPQLAPEPAPELAPEPASEPAREPRTVSPPKTSAAVQSAEPDTPVPEPSTTVERTPATSVAPTTTNAAPAIRPEAEESAESAESAKTSAAPSAALVPATDNETPSSSEKTVAETTVGEQSAEESDIPTVSIEQAAKEIETLAPETLEAPAEDVRLAKEAKPIYEPEPVPAPEQDIDTFKQSVDLTLGLNGNEPSRSAQVELQAKRERDFELVSNVRQWRPEWIEYDEFYRPVLMNPFRAPVRIVYVYDLRPRIVYIPPLARLVLEAARFAAYSFTAAVLAPINAAVDFVQAATSIAVGSFFGGGYYPGAGLPLPPPPPPVLRYDNVPVLVNYSNARYEPFRVRQIVDVGEDRVYGGRKVLLDGATPVWGEWTQTAGGERQFEVHRTQQFPGLSEPAEGPLPGDYRLRLASDEAATDGLTGRDVFLMVAAGVIGTLGFGAIGLAFFLGRRRPEH
jgi:hypothetical protein